MTYRETIDWLYQSLPMFHRQGASAMKADLDNTRAICNRLGNPQEKIKTIHIGGTNGKGSTAHLLAAAFQAAGYKTGLYISPHYQDFRERIKINGNYISQKYVTNFIENHQTFFEELQPSFFEMTVGLAFDFFAEQQVDIAIIEVGLGGRLDSTNIINPLLSVITNISFDHVQFLGNTLPKIAAEKAGIIKKNMPVVIGEYLEETAVVFVEKVKEMDGKIIFASKHYEAKAVEENLDFTVFDFFYNGKPELQQVLIGVSGAYQAKNVSTVRQTIEWVNKFTDFKIEEEAWKQGFKDVRRLTKFIGRWQRIGERPTILCDSGHNEAGILEVVKGLATMQFQQLHFVLGVVNDKDISKILNLLPKNAIYYFTNAKIPRALPAENLRQQGIQAGLQGRAYSSVRQALATAKRQAKPTDMIFIGGSIFVVAEAL